MLQLELRKTIRVVESAKTLISCHKVTIGMPAKKVIRKRITWCHKLQNRKIPSLNILNIIWKTSKASFQRTNVNKCRKDEGLKAQASKISSRSDSRHLWGEFPRILSRRCSSMKLWKSMLLLNHQNSRLQAIWLKRRGRNLLGSELRQAVKPSKNTKSRSTFSRSTNQWSI